MQEKQGKFHYAWLILIAAICIQGGIIGLFQQTQKSNRPIGL